MIAEEIHRITELLPTGVRLVAVSKYHPAEAVREAFAAGQRYFGESHAQELQRKHTELADLEAAGLEWHFIGHLQTNKVKYIAPYVSLIHSADSPHLLSEINKQALKAGRTIRCLLQLHVAEEETKFGFTPEEALDYLDSGQWQQLSGVEITGVMAMATNTDDDDRRRADFLRARQFFEKARNDYFSTRSTLDNQSPIDNPRPSSTFTELSMGMSDDWRIAVDCGATLIRIGTQIFGERNYG